MEKEKFIAYFQTVELKAFCNAYGLKYDYIRQVFKDEKRVLSEKTKQDLLAAIDQHILDCQEKRKNLN